MPRHTPAPPSWLARELFDLAVRLYPRFADPHDNPVPEILVVADGFQGGRLLKQVRHLRHLSVYWPGRGETYLAGNTVARVTFLAENIARRLSDAEYTMLRNRQLTWGAEALWLEV